MPILGGLLVNLFGGLVAWFTQWFARKVAYGLAAVALLSGLTLGLFILMRLTLATLAGASSGVATIFVTMMQLGVPPVASLCLSSYITIWTACTAYVWQRDLLHIAMRA